MYICSRYELFIRTLNVYCFFGVFVSFVTFPVAVQLRVNLHVSMWFSFSVACGFYLLFCVIVNRWRIFIKLGAVLDKNVWGRSMPPPNWGAEWSIGKNVPSPADKGLWGASWAEPRPETHFCIFWRHRTLFLHLYADALSPSNSVTYHVWGKAEIWGQFFPSAQRRTAPV